MANITLNWTPGGGANIVNQKIQYRPSSTLNWTLFTNSTYPTGLLPANLATITITGLLENTLYAFRVVSVCQVGGDIVGNETTAIKWLCPTIQTSSTYNTISYQIPDQGQGITGYTFQLLDGSLNVIQTRTTISGVFDSSSLAPSTAYSIRLILQANNTLTNNCTPVAVSTTAVPACPTPVLQTPSFS